MTQPKNVQRILVCLALTGLVLLAALMPNNCVEAGTHAERELARKLIKLMLAAAVFAPPLPGVFPLPLPVPFPFALETVKPPIFHGPFGPVPIFGGIGNLGLTEEFHNYYALPVLKNQVRGHAGLAAASTAAAAAKASAEAAASTPVASIQHIIKAQQEQEKKAKLYG